MRDYNKILILFIIILLSSFSASFGAPTPYKKKVLVQPFENPAGWLGDHNPGVLAADLIQTKIINDQNIILLNTKSSAKFKAQQGSLKDETPAQIIVTGRILKFSSVFPESLEIEENPVAEVKVEFQIKDGQTHRILERKIFQGKLPLKRNSLSSKDPLDPRPVDFYETPMGRLLNQMTDRWVPHFRNYLNRTALAGQIIEIEQENVIIVNVGWLSGVKIRDDFTVYEVSPNFKDRKHNTDLGDRYTQLGVVRIKIVQEGFSEGVIVAGENFEAGNLIRSKLIRPASLFMSKPNSVPTKPADSSPEPALDQAPLFQPSRVARTSVFSMDFFSLMGLTFEY